MNQLTSIQRYKRRTRSRHFDPGPYTNIAKQQAELDGVFVAEHIYLYEAKAKAVSAKGRSDEDPLVSELKELAGHYTLGEGAPTYLRKYPFLIQTLTLAIESIRREFREGYDLSVEVVDEGGHPKLFAVITTKMSAEEALARLDQFDRSWWFGVPARIRHFLEFTVDFA